MYLARVIGTVIASRKLDTLVGVKLQILQPVDEDGAVCGVPLIAVDSVSAGVGELVFYVSAREAILPMPDPLTPVDAAIVGIVDAVTLQRITPPNVNDRKTA